MSSLTWTRPACGSGDCLLALSQGSLAQETVNAEGEDEVEEEMDLPGLVSLAKAVVRQETEPEEEDDAQDEEEEVIPVPLKKAQAAAKDIQTFVLDNLTQFAHVEEVQAAANMLAQSLNKLTVSCTIRQRNILNFFSVLPRRIEWRQEEEEEQGAGEDEDCDLPEADTQ